MDLHTPGTYCVLDPAGTPLADTVETTGYSARATFCRTYNLLWSKAYARGHRVARLTVAETHEEPAKP